MSDEMYRKAQKRVKKKKRFYSHLSSFIAVGIFFLLINVFTYKHSHEWWFFFPMLPWAVGLIIHYFSVFGLPLKDGMTKDWEDKEIEKEMRKLARKEGKLIDNDDFDIDASLDLKELEKMREKKWDDDELV